MRRTKPAHKKRTAPNCRQTKPFTVSTHAKEEQVHFYREIKMRVPDAVKYSVLFGNFILPYNFAFVKPFFKIFRSQKVNIEKTVYFLQNRSKRDKIYRIKGKSKKQGDIICWN